MTALITHDDKATPKRMTGILRREGCLGHGRVVTVRKESPYFSGMSELSRLTLGQSSDASASVIVKVVTEDFLVKTSTRLHRKDGRGAAFPSFQRRLARTDSWKGS